MRDLVGATVVRCLTEVYVGPGESGDPRYPYCVSLALEDGTLATIEGAKDYESIAITERVPSAADMDEFVRCSCRTQDRSATPFPEER